MTGPGTLPVPALPVHHVPGVEAADARPAVGGGGLVVGVADDGSPAVLALFRAEPTAAVCLGGLPLAQRLVLRALALGAAVRVETDRPSAWSAVARLVADDGEVSVVPHERGRPAAPGEVVPGSPDRPRLLVLDGDAAVADDARRAGRWSAVLTCVDGTHQWARAALGAADVVVSRPLSRSEAGQLARVLNLDEALLRSTGRDDDLLLASRAGVRRVRHVITSVEHWLTGAARA